MGWQARLNGTAGKHALFGKTPSRLRSLARRIRSVEALDTLLERLPEDQREPVRAQLEPLVQARLDRESWDQVGRQTPQGD